MVEPFVAVAALLLGLGVLAAVGGLWVELRRLRRATQRAADNLRKTAGLQEHPASRLDPIRYAAAALLATRRGEDGRDAYSEEFLREFEDLLADWQHLDSRITELLDRIDRDGGESAPR